MQRHLHRVLHVKKIALLLAVRAILPVTFEKTDDTLFPHLGETFVDDAPHVALMVLIRAEDIEVLHADDAWEPTRALGVQIEEMLRVAVRMFSGRSGSSGAVSPMPAVPSP